MGAAATDGDGGGGQATEVGASTPDDFEPVLLAPQLPGGWHLLGEPSKWVGVSAARFVGLESDASHATAWLAGAVGEEVTVAWVAPGTTGQPGVLQHACTIGVTGELPMLVTWTNVAFGDPVVAVAAARGESGGWSIACEPAGPPVTAHRSRRG